MPTKELNALTAIPDIEEGPLVENVVGKIGTLESDDDESKNEVTGPDLPLATVKDVFSFAQSGQTKIFLVLGMLSSLVSGCVFPAMAFFFSHVFQTLGASTGSTDFLGNVRLMAFSFLGLG